MLAAIVLTMQPKVKITLTALTFVAMVLTGLAAAEQVPTEPAKPLLSPNIITLSPKVAGKKAVQHTGPALQDSLQKASAPR